MAQSDQAVRDIVAQLVARQDAPSGPAMGSLVAPRQEAAPAPDQMAALVQGARDQLASQPARLAPAPMSEADQAAMSPETFANPAVAHAMGSLATLPRRAIENSQYSLDSGTYDPGPTLEAATLPMGTGAIAGVPVRAGEAVLGAGPIRALPMDEASRLGRAAEQGYTIDAYKGGQPHDWNTMPEKNWKGEIINGTENRVPQELTSINSPNADYAGFFSNDPAVANRFAEPFEHGAVWPTKLRFDNPLVIDAEGKHAAAFQFETIAQRNGTLDKMDAFKKAFQDGSPHDGVILKNTKDEGDVYVPRNPDQIRSRFAAFDPASKGSGLLLGGMGGLAAIPLTNQRGQP